MPAPGSRKHTQEHVSACLPLRAVLRPIQLFGLDFFLQDKLESFQMQCENQDVLKYINKSLAVAILGIGAAA